LRFVTTRDCAGGLCVCLAGCSLFGSCVFTHGLGAPVVLRFRRRRRWPSVREPVMSRSLPNVTFHVSSRDRFWWSPTPSARVGAVGKQAVLTHAHTCTHIISLPLSQPLLTSELDQITPSHSHSLTSSESSLNLPTLTARLTRRTAPSMHQSPTQSHSSLVITLPSLSSPSA
jgi:hypothetical protein